MRKLEHTKDATRWHLRFLEMAELVSRWSKHPDFKVGAVAVGNFGQVMSTGFSGWPRGITGEDQARQVEKDGGPKSPPFTIHAETNLIYNAGLNGVSLLGSTIYVSPLFPCLECAKALVQVHVGQICVKQVDYPPGTRREHEELKQWEDSWLLSKQLFRETGTTIIEING